MATPAPYLRNGKYYNEKGQPVIGYTPPNTPVPPTVTGRATGTGTYAGGQAAYGGSNPAYNIQTDKAERDKYNASKAPTVSTPTPQVMSQQPAQPQMNLYNDPYARTPESIASLAKQRIDAILGAGRTSAQGALKGAKTAYDYTNQIEGDTRTLRNAAFKEENNPFSGRTGYLASNMLRNDSIADTFQDQEYNNQVSLINQKLADLEAAAPGQEAQIIDDLQQIERQTGISVAQLQEQQKNNQFNQFDQNRNYDRNIANDQYDQSPTNPINVSRNINNEIDQLKLSALPQELKDAAQKMQDELRSNKITLEEAEIKLKEIKDPNSFTNRTAKLEFEMKQLEAKNFPETERIKLQKLKKELADVGVAHYKPQTQAEKEFDEQQVLKIKAEIEKIKNGGAEADDLPKDSEINSFISKITNLYVKKIPYSDEITISDPVKAKNDIITKFYREDGKNDDLIDSLLAKFKLPIN